MDALITLALALASPTGGPSMSGSTPQAVLGASPAHPAPDTTAMSAVMGKTTHAIMMPWSDTPAAKASKAPQAAATPRPALRAPPRKAP